ncbi:MAG: type II toxin-antitoxin system VapC family toxin [Ardenticatenaceae bacterium]|nr:type II toxin-antitoxin system VapC family toxin [Ardenticatenaceae bacterium]MCB8987264.1 type II toxin-antitoxin system VapC family toxin [Ardenticatenaceae bacterium]
MNVVADTNIFLAVALDEPEKDRIVDLTAGVDAIAPEILPYEVANALSAMVKRNILASDEAFLALAVITAIPVRLIGIDIEQALKIAVDFNLYAYDAYFLQCAQFLSCPIITLDKRMKQVALELGIEVLE